MLVKTAERVTSEKWIIRGQNILKHKTLNTKLTVLKALTRTIYTLAKFRRFSESVMVYPVKVYLLKKYFVTLKRTFFKLIATVLLQKPLNYPLKNSISQAIFCYLNVKEFHTRWN